mmetsp:Transcript_1516/g.3230  ORF Transcript_1516/g.3230 Transcript_1516/m.3230 type:complete len:203 (-) Transcript_1516:46-654(-)
MSLSSTKPPASSTRPRALQSSRCLGSAHRGEPRLIGMVLRSRGAPMRKTFVRMPLLALQSVETVTWAHASSCSWVRPWIPKPLGSGTGAAALAAHPATALALGASPVGLGVPGSMFMSNLEASSILKAAPPPGDPTTSFVNEVTLRLLLCVAPDLSFFFNARSTLATLLLRRCLSPGGDNAKGVNGANIAHDSAALCSRAGW